MDLDIDKKQLLDLMVLDQINKTNSEDLNLKWNLSPTPLTQQINKGLKKRIDLFGQSLLTLSPK